MGRKDVEEATKRAIIVEVQSGKIFACKKQGRLGKYFERFKDFRK